MGDNSVNSMVLHQQKQASGHAAGSGWTGVNIVDKTCEPKDPRLLKVLFIFHRLHSGKNLENFHAWKLLN